MDVIIDQPSDFPSSHIDQLTSSVLNPLIRFTTGKDKQDLIQMSRAILDIPCMTPTEVTHRNILKSLIGIEVEWKTPFSYHPYSVKENSIDVGSTSKSLMSSGPERRGTSWVSRDLTRTKPWKYGSKLSEMVPVDMTSDVSRLSAVAGRMCGADFDCALINHYVGGINAGMGWHRDPDQGVQFGNMTAVVSIGSGARMRFRGGDVRVTMPVGHGDIVVMEGECQNLYEHRIDDRKGLPGQPVGDRYSVVFKESIT